MPSAAPQPLKVEGWVLKAATTGPEAVSRTGSPMGRNRPQGVSDERLFSEVLPSKPVPANSGRLSSEVV
ncbi:hypothetical protein D3C72_1020070 [compost metagenome]